MRVRVSPPAQQHTHVLKYSAVSTSGANTTARQVFDVWSPVNGWRGQQEAATNTFDPDVDTPCDITTNSPGCFLGDYKYGTYLDDVAQTSGTLTTWEQRFFFPYVAPDPTVVPPPGPSLFAHGVLLSQGN